MVDKESTSREGSLEAPERHTIDWRKPGFYDETSLFAELERVFDICHGCRRCFNLCNAFPTLFAAIDESPSMELDGVDKKIFWDVVDHCYLCDMCFMTKCPYVPPHEWNVDFPHLMLRAKAVKFKQGKVKARDKILTSTDRVGSLASVAAITPIVNWANRNSVTRKITRKVLGVHGKAKLPAYHSQTLQKRLSSKLASKSQPANDKANVLLFGTCYGNYNEPRVGEDMFAVFEYNSVNMALADDMKCCGMPKLELGDIESIVALKNHNVPKLAAWIEQGWSVVASVPSCVLMFKQELPLLFPDDAQVMKVKQNIYDPFEYLMQLHKQGRLNTTFKNALGKIAYHVACHQRVQNIGLKTRDVLQLIPETTVTAIERCSGHDGTYAVKQEFHETSVKILRPVVGRVRKSECDHYTSDCPMAGHYIEFGMGGDKPVEHPMGLLRLAYGI